MTYGTQQIPALVNELSRKDRDRHAAILKDLIEENYALGGPQHGFLFHGQFFTQLDPSQHRTAEKKMLQPQLHTSGRAFCEELRLFDREIQKITQGLHVILRPCNTAQDVRDMLPDTVTNMLPPEIAHRQRTRDPGWSFQGKPLHKHQFDEIIELLDFYVANRILL